MVLRTLYSVRRTLNYMYPLNDSTISHTKYRPTKTLLYLYLLKYRFCEQYKYLFMVYCKIVVSHIDI